MNVYEKLKTRNFYFQSQASKRAGIDDGAAMLFSVFKVVLLLLVGLVKP